MMAEAKRYPLLDSLQSPADIRQLTVTELEKLAAEIRCLLVDTVSQTGGHLAPSLGTVELTLALYSVYHFPEDKLVWDVGHQAYTHKILSGRRDSFHTLRQLGGITGFPKRSESEYDAFGVGHASTAISAALGMAVARDLQGRHNRVVAVLGDGALTGGLAYEGLNNAGMLHSDITVILNDNGRSIDANVGALSEYLSAIRIAPQYARAKQDVHELLSGTHFGRRVLKTAAAIKDSVRAALVPGDIFEEMGFHYVGPLDGHNIGQLQEVLRQVQQLHGPVLVHIHTQKGKGYAPAEADPERFHGVGRFDPVTGRSAPKTGPASYTSVFSKALIELARNDERLVAITAAMPSGTGLKAFGEAYPRRFFDVGIAEEHAVTVAAGLATEGIHPVVALYSTFAQRAYDEILHDVCLQNLPVTLCLDRAGLVGEDGPTHHGVFDMAYLRMMPHMTIFVPKDEEELRHMLATAVKMDSPTAIRYPRGAGLGVTLSEGFQDIPVGKAEVLQTGGEIALLAVGTMVDKAQQAAQMLQAKGRSCTVVNMRFVKPLDTATVLACAKESKLLVTLEEGALMGGFGSAVCEALADAGVQVPVLRLGIPDQFIEQGPRDELLARCGLQPGPIAQQILKYFEEENR
jgi:1-deoxy-D-xylulose-5-phosphate synthase